MENLNCSQPTQLISEKGSFNENIDRELDLGSGLVGVVSIMGVQSSGKSTFMNKCFNTNFKEMKEELGMTQTTKGIWMSKLSFSGGHQTLLLDCEGCDGAEQAKDGNETFERKIAFFALASSEVVIINMKCDSVNLNHGASMPLIQNVFQVMVRRFSIPKRVTLLFVLRDKSRVRIDLLGQQLRRQLVEKWENMCKDLIAPHPVFEDYFKVEVVALSHYWFQEEAFNQEIVELRKWIFELVENGNLSPAANFISLTKQNWNDIQSDKILNLQLNKNTANEAFFMKVKEEIIQKFCQDERWKELKKHVREGQVIGFGDGVSSLIDSHLSLFDSETKSFSEHSSNDCRAQVIERLLEVVEDTYLSCLEILKRSALEQFVGDIAKKIEKLDSEFDEQYTLGFFTTIKEARVEQAKHWNQPDQSFDEAKHHMPLYVKLARDTIEQLKSLHAQQAAAVPTTDVHALHVLQSPQQAAAVPATNSGVQSGKASGKKYMLSAKELSIAWKDTPIYWTWKFMPESRFAEVAELKCVYWLDIQGKIHAQRLSKKTTYSAYLVFRLTEDSCGLDVALKASVRLAKDTVHQFSSVILVSGDPPNRWRGPPDCRRSQRRRDGWMEICLGEIYNDEGEGGDIEMKLWEIEIRHMKRGLILEGIEIRPK